MTIALTDTARVVAQLLAHRQTPQEEVSSLVRNVHLALTHLADPQPSQSAIARAPAASALSPDHPKTNRRPRREHSDPVVEAVMEDSEPAPPPPPKLLRRAEVVTALPTVSRPLFDVPNGALRGVVKWFDAQARRGALRLPGHGGDMAVDAQLLTEMGISRLYKGQEVEATLSEEAEPRVIRLALPGGTDPVISSSGFVRGRHAKPVVVELKREAMRRVAARAEAELLLRPGRAR